MGTEKTDGSSAAYLNIINYARKANGKNALETDKGNQITATNDAVGSSDNKVIYVKVNGDSVDIKNEVTAGYTKVDLSDGLSIEELKALGIDVQGLKILGIAGRGWKLDAPAEIKEDDSIIDDKEAKNFTIIITKLMMAECLEEGEAWAAYFDKETEFGMRDLDAELEAQLVTIKALEEDEGIKSARNFDDFINVLVTRFGISRENPIIINAIRDYSADISKGYTGVNTGADWPGSKCHFYIICYFLRYVAASRYSEKFQKSILNLAPPILIRYEKELMTVEDIKLWAKQLNPASANGLNASHDPLQVGNPLNPLPDVSNEPIFGNDAFQLGDKQQNGGGLQLGQQHDKPLWNH